jgi:hypothetical protein
MSFDITIQHDLKKLMQGLNTLETKVAPQATVRTLNRVAESAKVASAKHIAPQMNSRQAAVKRRIETRKATFKTLWATLVARDRKTRTLSKAFIAPRRRGSSKTTVYMRKSGKRLPLKMLYGPGIMQLFRQRENDQVMQMKVLERFPVEFRRNLDFYISRLKRR